MSDGRGDSWVHRPPQGDFDAIVVGSGMGGLVSAAALSKAGRRVLVLEQHHRLGGLTHSFRRPGFEWDVGLHYVGALAPGGLLRKVFELLSDGSVEWVPLPRAFDVVEWEGARYELHAGRDAFRDELQRAFPSERRAIDEYLRLVQQGSAQLRQRLLGAASGRQWVASNDLIGRTTAAVLEPLNLSHDLHGVLTAQYGDYGLPPARSSFGMHAMLVDHYLDGAWYPRGGAGVLAPAFGRVIEGAGGQLTTAAEVTSLRVEDGRVVGVRLGNGAEVRAPLIVSAAGVLTTFGRWLEATRRPARWNEVLSSARSSTAFLCLSLGLSRTDEALELTGANVWQFPSPNHDANVARFETDSEAPFPMLYFSFPSAKDPGFQSRAPGKATVQLITCASWDWFAEWEGTQWQKRGPAYDAFKQRLQDRLIAATVARFPQLQGAIEHVELSTPLSMRHFTGQERGGIYGLEVSPARFAMGLGPETGLGGLVLSGGDVATPGIAGAALGGLLAAGAVLGRAFLPPFLSRG